MKIALWYFYVIIFLDIFIISETLLFCKNNSRKMLEFIVTQLSKISFSNIFAV